MTFDRLVAQKIPTLTIQPYFTNIIPLTPALYSHPGYKQKATDMKQDKLRPYKLTSIYKLYNKGTPKEYTYVIPDDQKENLDQVGSEEKSMQKGGQRGGLFGAGTYKSIYQTEAVKYSSNFISIPINSVTGLLVPHIFYLGMVFLLTPRFLGMKNPVPINEVNCAYFGFYDDPGSGVLIKYVNFPHKTLSRGVTVIGEGSMVAELQKPKRRRRTRVNTVYSGGKGRGRKTRRRAEK
jgi:hypothetical protein